jgi:hypothetical protein
VRYRRDARAIAIDRRTRCRDEQLHVSQCARIGSLADDRRAKRARRIYRNARHVDPDNMDRDQRQPDRQAGEFRRTTFFA